MKKISFIAFISILLVSAFLFWNYTEAMKQQAEVEQMRIVAEESANEYNQIKQDKTEERVTEEVAEESEDKNSVSFEPVQIQTPVTNNNSIVKEEDVQEEAPENAGNDTEGVLEEEEEPVTVTTQVSNAPIECTDFEATKIYISNNATSTGLENLYILCANYWDQPTKSWLLGFIEESKEQEAEDAATKAATDRQKVLDYYACLDRQEASSDIGWLSPSQQSTIRDSWKSLCGLYLN